MEVSGQLHAPGKETPIPIGYEVGWTPEPVRTLNRKFFTLPGLELRPLGRPTRNQSLYRLSYPGSALHKYVCEFPARI
jgi:hypothetical protein